LMWVISEHFVGAIAMSALPPKADISQPRCHFR